jgi:hypothetical protein
MNTAQPRGGSGDSAGRFRILGTASTYWSDRAVPGPAVQTIGCLQGSHVSPVRIETVKPGWPETGWQWVRFGGNFINLSTLVGLAVAKIGRAEITRGPRGLFLGEHYRLKFPIAGAFTIGNVITTTNTWDQMMRRYPFLIKHEEVHSWQYFYCLGLPYYIPYVICMGWSVLRTGDRAAQNFFERQAGLTIGGYQDYPVRPIGEGVRAVLGKLKLTRS